MRRPPNRNYADQYDIVEINELRELREIRARALAKQPQGRPPIAGLPLGWALVVIVVINAAFAYGLWLAT